MKKRILAMALALAMLLPMAVTGKAWAARSDTFEVSNYTKSVPPKKDGYVFAGWYTDSTFTAPYTASSGIATAKFVAEDVLRVKFQINNGTVADDASTRLRIVTTVDTLDYQSVGFVVQWAGEASRELTTKKVYRSLTGTDSMSSYTYTPSQAFHSESAYFCAYNFTVPNAKFDTDFTVTPVWVTADGTRVTGVTRTLRVSENAIYSPQATVAGYELVGTWAVDRVTTGASASLAPDKSYDGNISTRWNPQVTDYASGEGIIYKLDRAYDLTKVKLTFSDTLYYFNLYASSDGVHYTLLQSVARANATNYYVNSTCTIKGFAASAVTHVKIVFTGSNISTGSDAGKYITWYETTFMGRKMEVDQDGRKATAVDIIEHDILGTWATEQFGSNKPERGYDHNEATMWNAQATDYASGEGIVYTLENARDLTQVQVDFKYRDHYFDLYASPDGKNYTLVRSITPVNAAAYYTNHSCVIQGLRAFGATHIKLIFTGSSDSSLYINFYEISVMGKTPVDIREEVSATVTGHKLAGTWADPGTADIAKSYDGSTTTRWNPTATDYASGEGVIYTLDRSYDLTKIKLTFSARKHWIAIYTSPDGENWTLAQDVTSANNTSYYTSSVSGTTTYWTCTVNGLDVTDAGYVKIVFNGTNANDKYVNFYEAEFFGRVTTLSTENMENTAVMVSGNEVIGTWAGSNAVYAYRAYDGSNANETAHKWNPNTNSKYTNGEGIVFELAQTYDSINSVTVEFTTRYHYFDILVSSDGTDYKLARSVSAVNRADFYNASYVCTIDDLNASSVRYVKLLFTGSSSGVANEWVNFLEITFTSLREIDNRPEVPTTIMAHELSGTWRTPGTADIYKTYDGNTATKWNPVAESNYTGSPSVIYTLDNVYNLTGAELTFSDTNGAMYFDLSVSADGETFSNVLSVTSANASTYYAEDPVVCTIGSLDTDAVRYVKITFTGRIGENSLYVNFNEIALTGKLVPDPREEVSVTISAHEILGTWTNAGATNKEADKSYDGNESTAWNAAVSGTASSIVYTLDDTYNLTGATLVFGDREMYFDMYVSTDGASWTKAASVTGISGHYSNGTCTLTGLNTVDASYVKLTFTGHSMDTTWFNLYEITFLGESRHDYREEAGIAIASFELVGAWARSYTTGNLPAQSYDGNSNTKWNPQASANYGSSEGVVYHLDGAYDLTEIALAFSARDHYFDLYVSADGVEYEKVCSVTAGNASSYYTNHVCTISDLHTSSTRYVKILFTGSSDSQLYVNLYEISITGKEPLSEVIIAPEEDMQITGHALQGTWAKEYSSGNPPANSYDENLSTKWNPQASSGYSGSPSIIYTLAHVYDLTQLQVTVSARRYYFDLYVSAYGTSYTRVAQVTSSNADLYYSGYVCTMNWSGLQNVQYVKLVFTGSEDGNLFVNLQEICIRGRATGDVGDLSARNNATARLAGTDSLGRSVAAAEGSRSDKAVGVFYFLWLGATGTEGPYDVSVVKSADPNAGRSNEAWLAAGGGEVGQRHWWGESLFGYYCADDEWVIDRDVQMLTDAGVDFLALDYTNGVEYPGQLLKLLSVLDRYAKQGFAVPRITFITRASSGIVVMDLYEEFYLGHPEYAYLWYQLDGKPLMIGVEDSEAISDACRAYFTWRYCQWPREAYRNDGFPWMDFSRPQTLYGSGTGTTVMNVSVAQHSGTLAFSSSALYGNTTNHTRNYHNGANDTSTDAVLYGYNFAEQFEYAIEQDPDIIFVTGWNEWIATRQASWKDMNGNPITDPVILVDNCDINNSRDIQPMKGGYGDNYYMQLVSYIRQYKGLPVANSRLNTAAPVEKITIDVSGSFDQWTAVRPYYLDYTGDTEDRNHAGFGSLVYADDTGRNDLYKMKMTHDAQKLYAYAETVEDISDWGSARCMTLFLATGRAQTWCGYDYAINRTAAGNTLSVERWNGSAWVQVGTAEYTVSGNRVQLAIPLSLLGLSSNNLSVEFKWADNYQEEDIYNFYLHGDAAPYGRLNYVYTYAVL